MVLPTFQTIMNLPQTTKLRLLRLIGVPVCLITLLAPCARAQVAPVATADAGALARYDANRNGRLDPEEAAARDAAQTSSAPVNVELAPRPAGGETLVLSPFEVVSENKGYFSANSMSGTRMNSKIEDLGQSITVMTKEQMIDFAMLDINDVFDYMASTEGTGSYSQFDTDRTGAVVDQVSLNPNNANRVRGIGNANIAFNNIATTGRVPVDPLWMDSLELSRGPNANIFGLGNASGTVNQVPATANLSRNFTRVETRGDSYDGWRASLDVNRILLKQKLSAQESSKDIFLLHLSLSADFLTG
jgi:outer membrane receptor for ferric coprogen and ferric-rhodotorulic acid